MQASHINPQEAVHIHNDVHADLSIGMHWGTFQLTAEPMMEPQHKLHKLVNTGALQRGKFETMKIGESVVFTSAMPHENEIAASLHDSQ